MTKKRLATFTLVALGLVMAAGAPPTLARASSCHPVQCPPAGATTSPWCAASTLGVCATTPTLPPGFTADPDTSISIPVPGKPPVIIPLSKAVGSLGSGGLCCGVVATATADVTLYRAWAPHYDGRSKEPKGYASSWQFGTWWSADQPDAGSHRTYRLEEDICVTWNSLSVYSSCTLPKGTQVFIGPGQSACCPGAGCQTPPGSCPGTCPEATYLLESPALQIYVPDYVDPETGAQTQSTQKIFDDCETFVWPR